MNRPALSQTGGPERQLYDSKVALPSYFVNLTGLPKRPTIRVERQIVKRLSNMKREYETPPICCSCGAWINVNVVHHAILAVRQIRDGVTVRALDGTEVVNFCERCFQAGGFEGVVVGEWCESGSSDPQHGTERSEAQDWVRPGVRALFVDEVKT